MAADRERPRVFISAKSADYDHAQRVYEMLTSAGVPAFFSRSSLPDLGSSDHRREIDRALDEVDHMVVVTSSKDNVLATWVEAEWGFFVNEKRSGRKGNLVTVVAGRLMPADLPPSLRHYEVIPLNEDGLARLLRYVGERGSQRSPESRTLAMSRLSSPPVDGWPRRRFLTLALSVTALAVAGAGSWYVRPSTTDGGVRVAAPRQNDLVSLTAEVSGTIAGMGKRVWVIVHPLETNEYWVQGLATTSSDRAWSISAQFGRSGATDRDKWFQVMAIVNPYEPLSAGAVLGAWPKAEGYSEIIDVLRK